MQCRLTIWTHHIHMLHCHKYSEHQLHLRQILSEQYFTDKWGCIDPVLHANFQTASMEVLLCRDGESKNLFIRNWQNWAIWKMLAYSREWEDRVEHERSQRLPSVIHPVQCDLMKGCHPSDNTRYFSHTFREIRNGCHDFVGCGKSLWYGTN